MFEPGRERAIACVSVGATEIRRHVFAFQPQIVPGNRTAVPAHKRPKGGVALSRLLLRCVGERTCGGAHVPDWRRSAVPDAGRARGLHGLRPRRPRARSLDGKLVGARLGPRGRRSLPRRAVESRVPNRRTSRDGGVPKHSLAACRAAAAGPVDSLQPGFRGRAPAPRNRARLRHCRGLGRLRRPGPQRKQTSSSLPFARVESAHG